MLLTEIFELICIQQDVKRLYPTIRKVMINAMVINALDIKSMINIPIAIHINIKPITRFIRTPKQRILIIIYALTGINTPMFLLIFSIN